jgi:carbonic anhydrase
MAEHLLHGYQQFRREYFEGERDFLKRLATEGQNPSALYIGCSDSRVVPELLTSSKPGELFVVRNIANLAPELDHADSSVGAAVDYAVGVLQVANIIICGHYGCGGVKATLDGRDKLQSFTSLYEWLGCAQPGINRARTSGLSGDALFRRAVEENVLYQMANLITFPPVASRLPQLRLHGWVYDLESSHLVVYDVNRDQFVGAEQLIS